MESKTKKEINFHSNRGNNLLIKASTEAYTGLSDYIKINPALHPIVYVKNA